MSEVKMYRRPERPGLPILNRNIMTVLSFVYFRIIRAIGEMNEQNLQSCLDKVKNCYVVVSEIAKSHSKPVSSGSRQYVSAAAVLAAFAIFSVSNVATVQAADIIQGDGAKTSNMLIR